MVEYGRVWSDEVPTYLDYIVFSSSNDVVNLVQLVDMGGDAGHCEGVGGVSMSRRGGRAGLVN